MLQSASHINASKRALQMCLRKSEAEKAQPLPVFPGWRFYFTDSDGRRVLRCFHPDLEGLRIISGNGTVFSCLESALRTYHYSKAVAAKKIQEFYEKHLGIRMRCQLNQHELLGKGFYRIWIGK